MKLCLCLCLLALAGAAPQARKPKPGVSNPNLKIPLSRLTPEARFVIPGSPDWIAVGKDVWVSNKPKGNVSRLSIKTNTVTQVISGLNKPCSGLAIGFGSLWVPACGDQSLVRIDLESGKITGSARTGIADSEGGIAIGAGSVWMLTDSKSTLSRIDPQTNAVTVTASLPQGCYTPAFGFHSVWVTCTKQNFTQVPVGPEPRFLSVGEDAVWTLNQGDGSVTRVSPKTNKVEASIEVGIPGEGGDISAGEGSVWATSFGFPISRIDPKTNRVVQQFVGVGGDAIRAGAGFVWLSNYMLGTELKFSPKAIVAASGH
jgi:virginiamycin B lyase